MERHRLDKQPVAAARQPRRNGDTPAPRQPGNAPGPAQKPVHPPRPVPLAERRKRLQRPQTVRMAQRVFHPLDRPVALPCPTRPQARPRAARPPDTPRQQRRACVRPPTRSPVSSGCFTRARPAASAWTGTPARRRRPAARTHSAAAPPQTPAPRTAPTELPTDAAPAETARDAATPPPPQDEDPIAPGPTRPTGTRAASPPRNDRSAAREPDAPPPPKGGALEGRTAGAQPLRPPAPHPTRTPRSPGSTPGHGPPHDPGAPHAAASPRCGPACAPSSPASSVSGAGPPASQAPRSRAACRCCGSATQDGAPTPLSARQDAPPAPEAPRSLPPGAQPAPPDSRIPTPTKALAASRTRSWAGSPMVPTHCQPTHNRKHPRQSRNVMVCICSAYMPWPVWVWAPPFAAVSLLRPRRRPACAAEPFSARNARAPGRARYAAARLIAPARAPAREGETQRAGLPPVCRLPRKPPARQPPGRAGRPRALCHGVSCSVMVSMRAVHSHFPSIRPASPVSRLRHGSLLSSRPGAIRPPPACRRWNPFPRVTRAPGRARYAAARFARLIAPARAKPGARHTSPFRFPGVVFRAGAGAKREAKRPRADAACFPRLHPSMDCPESRSIWE